MQLTVLIYCARSGSTFLAERIARERSHVVVVPEFRTPLMLLWRSEQEVRSLDSSGLSALFRRDFQFDNLGLQAERTDQLAVELAGAGRREILAGLLRAYRDCRGLSGQHFLLKNGQIAFAAETLREIWPEVSFLHILRDPRGVVNSMMGARTVYGYGGPMAGGDPLKATQAWLRHREASLKIRATMISVEYETLLSSPQVLEPKLERLFGPIVESHDSAASTDVVSAKERSLHRLVGGKPDPGRMEAWKSSISREAGIAIEAALGSALTEAGYVPYFSCDAGPEEIAAAIKRQRRTGRWLSVRHASLTCLHLLRQALRAPEELWFRIENTLRSRS